jgi:hypothetical protein
LADREIAMKCWPWHEAAAGYGGFSVSPSQLPVVKKYIANQEAPHRRQSFEEEFTTLLRVCGVEFDPKIVFG